MIRHRGRNLREAVLQRISDRGDMEIPVSRRTLASLFHSLEMREDAAHMLESGDPSYDVPARVLEVLVLAAERAERMRDAVAGMAALSNAMKAAL